ncbi:MAG TPA: sulfatase-like hydrolase/transferase [Chitinophagales bacterium]|jgi:arylsulfatase A-like enzyme|nr:sulfatase-like hydrolase/transferase [Chitinophagales bacterium]HQV78446.1 sulfatase-like hydrolase/transferase [Chitinophagales bacterium]HQW78868.1 sulfatase-like hydrolase/transferase [Chitinophagales bacterium]HRB67316.1 sulfatase-like hydrolase/transferase [Chitinophagales bacterium]HRB92435.1 sulfatase-like hydrolase/transferase [Chitinophagales bacterium]
MKKHKRKIVFPVMLTLLVSTFFVSCYPLSTGAKRWRIKFDKNLLSFKKQYLEDTLLVNEHQPNIILIVADDLGINDVSSYGNSIVETPNIDALAKEGVRCTQAYVTSAVCAPSRCGILTGRYQQRSGFETQQMEYYPTNIIEYLTGKYVSQKDSNWVIATKPRYPYEWQIAKQGIPPTEINLAELLKKADYTTGIIGKWHLGQNPNLNIPNKRGFDYQYGCYGAFTLYSENVIQDDIVNYKRQSFSAKYQWDMARKDDAMIYENNHKIRHEKQYITDAIRDRSIRFIDENKNKPFFLYIPFTAPHEPYQAQLDLYIKEFQKVKDKKKAVYNSIIRSLDNAIGKILQKVKDEGLDENTLIIFMSDNGSASYTGITSNEPLKGGKLTLFEGGINVPFILKWKNHLPENSIYQNPIISLDIFSTVSAIANIPLPNDRVYDGVNLIPFLKNEIQIEPHKELFWRIDHAHAIRKGQYKLIFSSRDQWKELYDLENDKGENFNLIDSMPEKAKELEQDLLKWENTLPKKPLWPRIMDYKFILDGKTYLFPA